MNEQRIAELRALRGSGMTSAVGEYTPDELWEALDDVERLRATLRGIVEADYRKWWELAHPEEFVRWAKSRAAHALAGGI